MRGLAIYGIVVFGLAIIHCIFNLVLGLGYEIGNSIVGLAVSIPIFIFCSLYLWKGTKKMKHSTAISKVLRYLAPYYIIVLGVITIQGIYDIIFGHNYGIGITVAGLMMIIPMLIFCHRYLWNEAKKEAEKKVPLIILQRSLEGIQLGETVAVLERNSAWKEIVGSEKAIFESGLSGERLFTMFSGEKTFVCGFVFNTLYKVSVMISASDTNLYLRRFTDKYEQPIKFKRGCYEWQDEKTVLNLMIVGSQRNIILTDRNLLKKAYGVQ